jgi:hypothetical protein
MAACVSPASARPDYRWLLLLGVLTVGLFLLTCGRAW